MTFPKVYRRKSAREQVISSFALCSNFVYYHSKLCNFLCNMVRKKRATSGPSKEKVIGGVNIRHNHHGEDIDCPSFLSPTFVEAHFRERFSSWGRSCLYYRRRRHQAHFDRARAWGEGVGNAMDRWLALNVHKRGVGVLGHSIGGSKHIRAGLGINWFPSGGFIWF